MEPLFRLLVVKRFYEFFGIVVDHTGDDEKDKQLQNDTLNSFLNSSLNVELVFVILKSITTFASASEEVKDGNLDSLFRTEQNLFMKWST